MYPSPLKGINSTVLSKSQTWMTAATHSEFSIKSNFCLKDIPTSPGLCFDEEKVHNSGLPGLLVLLSSPVRSFFLRMFQTVVLAMPNVFAISLMGLFCFSA